MKIADIKKRAEELENRRLGAFTLEDIGTVFKMLKECIKMLGDRPVPVGRYNYDKKFPTGDAEFLGLYPDGKQMIIRRASEPMENLQFVTEHGGPPHYVCDPVGWAPLPDAVQITVPIEHTASKFKINGDMAARLDKQRKEFDTLDNLVSALRKLPAVVDDDYPEMRHYYDSALRDFLRACIANGRMEQLHLKVHAIGRE